jgi:hypothetical protein
VKRPFAHRVDRALDRGESRDDDDDLLGIPLPDLAQNLHPRHAGQHEIEQDQVDRLAFERQQRVLAGASDDRSHSFPPQEQAEDVLQDLFVVDDEDVHPAELASSLSSGSSTEKRQPRRGRFSNRRRPPCCSTMA